MESQKQFIQITVVKGKKKKKEAAANRTKRKQIAKW